MPTFEASIPTKKLRDALDTLELDHGIVASMVPLSEGKYAITIEGGTKESKSAIKDVLATVGGDLVKDDLGEDD
ncbi:MAG: hypothetical protein KBA40_03620 [Candidatus Peribacteraceae bacterium]|nr:hypothetical protein [Candidatus Peribacteraceae bacterium]MBP9850329.1 hypothetical protein [Candidatus Peribacteraceae bacterium]